MNKHDREVVTKKFTVQVVGFHHDQQIPACQLPGSAIFYQKPAGHSVDYISQSEEQP